jgi:hypothetical protein
VGLGLKGAWCKKSVGCPVLLRYVYVSALVVREWSMWEDLMGLSFKADLIGLYLRGLLREATLAVLPRDELLFLDLASKVTFLFSDPVAF